MCILNYDNFCELTNQNIPYHILITTKTLRPRSCGAKELNLLSSLLNIYYGLQRLLFYPRIAKNC